MNAQSYVRQLNQICDQIKNEVDENIIVEYAEQLYEVLQLAKKDGVQFEEQQLQNIKQVMQDTFTSIVDNGVLTKQQITKPTSILNSVDIVDVELNGEKVASKILNVGLVALLMSCSTMFADVVKSQNDPKVNTVKILKNSSDSQIAKYAMPLLRYFQGTVRGNVYDSEGNILYKNVHIVYDDNKGTKVATPWDGKSDLDQFISNCNGKPTIGYGITNRSIVSKGYLTDEQAETYLRSQLMKRIKEYKQFVGVQVIESLTYTQQACLMTLWFNLPPYKTPNCVKYLQFAYKTKNAQKRNIYLKKAAHEFLDCNKSGGKVSKGLTKRVNALNKLFLRDVK